MGRVIAVVATLAAMAAAVWLSRPEGRGGAGHAFQRPGVIDIEHPDGVGTSRHVVQVDGRVITRNAVRLTYRWLLDPVEVEVVAPDGVVGLVLDDGEEGADAPAMRIGPEQIAWRGADGERVERPRRGLRFGLRYEDGRWSLLEDGEVLARLDGPPPGGKASLRMEPGSSFRAFTARLADGDVRTVDGGEVISHAARAAWASLSVLGGVLCLAAWRRARIGTAGTGARVLAVATIAGVTIAAVSTLHVHNAERLGRAPEPCSDRTFRQEDARFVTPGSPWDLSPRRDGDFVLTADVVLDERSVLDVLLRASPADRDTGLILTLSTDPALASSLSRNLGTFLETESAPDRLATLAPRTKHALWVSCRGGETVARLDDRKLATLRDWDLRAGRCAFLVLRGRAVVENLVIEPLGPPAAADGVLHLWEVRVALGLLAGLVLAAVAAGRGAAGGLWAWPLAASVAPGAPEGFAAAGAAAAALLLLPTPRGGRRVMTWLVGAGVIAIVAWAAGERAPANARGQLNSVHITDVWGPPIPREYIWARHPLCRRFSSYVRAQSFREAAVRSVKPAGVVRVAALGSSSTFGYGVLPQDAFIEQLAARLRRDGHRVEALNCGQPGATAERLHLFLEGAVLQFNPDVVIIDLSFNDVHVAAYDERAHFAAMTTTGIGPLQAVWARLAAIVDVRGRARFSAAYYRGEEPDEDLARRYSRVPAQRFAASLRDMIAAARGAGAAVVLVAEPYNRRRGRTAIEANHAAMAALAAELDVPLVAPQARLEEAQQTREVFLDAVHPNREGHAILAEMLAEALTAEGLLTK